MTDEGNAPTIPDTAGPTHGSSAPGIQPKAPDSRYTLRNQLGQGGMGEVWLAHDVRVDREIAIKLMRGAKEPDLVARFLREARVQGRLEHPSIVPVHDLGGDEASPFFAMKRLAGTTLADVISARDEVKWPRRTLLARFVDICLAVEFAHQRGVVHRDLKPANIMLGDFGEAYVLDWGIARLEGDIDSGLMRHSDLAGDSGVQTEVGAVLGTPGYMSPEQLRGDAIDKRTDVYALGCILFEILVGSAANPRVSPIESTLSTIAHSPIERGGDVPPELDNACVRATKADAGSRLGSARELADLVQSFLDGDRDTARRRELAAEHVVKAQALARHEDEGRRTEAIREAGSAIALDVHNTDAQQLLARLLLAPPDKIPAEALRAIAEERRIAGLEVLRWGAVAYFFFLLAMPILLHLGISERWPVAVFAGEVVVMMTICLVALRKRVLIGNGLAYAVLIGHSLMLATIGVLLGPLFLTPTLIFGSATIMFTVQSIRLPKTIVTAHLLVLIVPLALEWTGITPSSFALTGGGLFLKPWALDMAPSVYVALIVGGSALQLVGNMLVLDRQRVAQTRAEERNHAQKWQLQQLVPSSGPSA